MMTGQYLDSRKNLLSNVYADRLTFFIKKGSFLVVLDNRTVRTVSYKIDSRFNRILFLFVIKESNIYPLISKFTVLLSSTVQSRIYCPKSRKMKVLGKFTVLPLLSYWIYQDFSNQPRVYTSIRFCDVAVYIVNVEDSK